MHGNTANTDEYLEVIPDWQRYNLSMFRSIVHLVYPDVHEEIKRGVPVFIIDKKLVFVMSSFKDHSKFNFIFNGATLNDSQKLRNNGFESKKSRGINLREGEPVDQEALDDLVRQATVAL